MHEQNGPRLAKWPFFAGDVLLLGAAYFIYYQSKLPMVPWQIAFVLVCVAGGACLAIMPFLLEYRVAAKLAETRELAGVVSQIRNLEAVAAQISGATNRWHNVQEEADKTAAAAKAIADLMAAEVQAFTEFMQRANDGEKATLRLEVEKSRRAENDWLQVLVRMLDHVYALNQGALRSGQPNLIQQMGAFQNACRDAARRVGLMPVVAVEAEPFNAQRHELVDGNGHSPTEGIVAETVAAGYTFQGRLLRPALVRLRDGQASATPPATPAPAAPKDRQNCLPL
jgi:molecular chaperone GrpE (heat shock protein)